LNVLSASFYGYLMYDSVFQRKHSVHVNSICHIRKVMQNAVRL